MRVKSGKPARWTTKVTASATAVTFPFRTLPEETPAVGTSVRSS